MTVALRSTDSRSRRAADLVPIHIRLHAANQRVDAMWFEACKAANLEDLTPRQFHVLETVSALREEDPKASISQTTLVECTGIDRSTLADVARRLVDKGLLARERREDDLRAYNLHLTSKGVRVVTKARPIAASIAERLSARISAADQSKLGKLLAIIAQPEEAAK